MQPIKRIPSLLFAATAAMIASARGTDPDAPMVIRPAPYIPGHVAAVRTITAIQYLDFRQGNQRKTRARRRRLASLGVRDAHSRKHPVLH